MKLSHETFELALTYIECSGRPLEAARTRYHFRNGPLGDVAGALRSFQNEDGGFGRAIEPDLRAPESSAIGTAAAFQIMRECSSDGFGDMPARAVSYLVETFDESALTWRKIPRSADGSSHAPWWEQKGREDVFDSFSLNPTAEILGYLYDCRKKVPAGMLSIVTDRVADHLSGSDSLEMHELLSCLRLLETRSLPGDTRELIRNKLSELAAGAVACDPEQWEEYSLRPLQMVQYPESPFMNGLEEAVAKNLDYEIKTQNSSGSWTPTWSWYGTFPNEWETAKKEWSGIITLEKLLVLKRFGRIEGPI